MSTVTSLVRRAVYEWFYLVGKPRWDTGITPPELRDLVENEHLPAGLALDIGCGTGTNAIYLAKHEFEVTGVDFIPRAITKARKKAEAANVQVNLKVMNVLEPVEFPAPFDFVLDIGCFHNFDGEARTRYAANLVRWTHPASSFLLYAFYPLTAGPRRFGVEPSEIEKTFAPRFGLVNSTVGKAGSEQDSAWYQLERLNDE